MKQGKLSVSRRTLLQWGGALSAPLVVPPFCREAFADTTASDHVEEKIVQTCSTFDCGGKCIIRAHTRDGKLSRISARTDAQLNPDMPIMRACVRGRGYRAFQNHVDRLKYPMKRVGKRGEGKFERISWDEATTYISNELKRITDGYGPASRFLSINTAVTGGPFSGDLMFRRLLNATGGFLERYHSVSMGNTLAATIKTYGAGESGSTYDTLLDSKLIILWGHNPTETIFGHMNYYLKRAKEAGIKIIVVDPRYSDSAAAYATEWIPILPSTDNALMDAMAYVIVSENLHDKAFLDKFCLGFDEEHMPEGVPKNESYLSYLMGEKDGIKKTPEWAEKICKVPARKIRQLAIEYATTKPAALVQGWGPQRHACGERVARGGAMLASLTGNVGILGGWASGYGGVPGRKFASRAPTLENPVKTSISIMNWTQAVEDASKVTPQNGLKGGEKLDTNIKALFSIAGNYLANQNPDINATVKLLADPSKVELIVVSDLFMTPSAKFADILLPSASFLERWNIGETWSSGNYLLLSEKVVEPEFERRTDYEWIREVARKLGVEEIVSENRSEYDWIKKCLEDAKAGDAEGDYPTWEEFLKNKVHYFKTSKTVAFEKQIKDFKNNPFLTPSGKIELFSKEIYDMQNVEAPALPKYVASWEGPEDELTKEFPLQCITWKGKNRANSTMYASPWMKDVQTQKLWINPIDAKSRGIRQGDLVKIFNKRGTVMIPADITPRIIPGVVAMQSAAWWDPDENGVDRGGNANVLNSTRMTPIAKGNAHQTMLVEVERT